MAVGSHSSSGRSRDATLESELVELEREAKRHRAQTGAMYSRLLLARTSGVPEATFTPWLTGGAVPGDADGDLMAVVRTLALWAGQRTEPEPRDWLSLATATRKRQAVGAGRKLVGLLREHMGWVAGIISGIIVTVVGGVTVAVATTPSNARPCPSASVLGPVRLPGGAYQGPVGQLHRLDLPAVDSEDSVREPWPGCHHR